MWGGGEKFFLTRFNVRPQQQQQQQQQQLWQILILGGAFEQEGTGGAGGGRDTSICARKLKILEGDKSDGCRIAIIDLFISPTWYWLLF